MPGFMPGIHAFLRQQDVDGRDKPGHDEGRGCVRTASEWRAVAEVPEEQQALVMSVLYDTIGINYAELRKPDPRIAKTIEQALGPARTVLNVGAGTGSYEPADREVTAVEPSAAMIAKRSPAAAKAIQ